MLQIQPTSRFKKDLKRYADRRDFAETKRVIEMLERGEKLPPKYKEHKLKGIYHECLECHIKPDWLMIYEITETHLILHRTGSHSELFG